MKLFNRLNKGLQRLESRPFQAEQLIVIVLFVGIGRTLLETLLCHEDFGLLVMAHYTTFYLPTFFGFTIIASCLLKQHWKRVSNVISMGIFAGILPPLLDILHLNPGEFRYRYLDSIQIFFHGAGNPPGEAITAWMVLTAFFLYILIRSRSFLRAFSALLIAYAFLMLMVYPAPILCKHLLPFIGGATACSYIYIFTAFILYILLNRDHFWPSLKRLNHSLPWVLLVIFGAVIAGHVDSMTWLQASVVLFLHQGVIFANDYFDRKSDQINNRPCRLDRNDALFTHFFMIGLVLIVCLYDAIMGQLYLLYLLVTSTYHLPQIKLKNIFPLNYLSEGLVAALAFTIGLLSAQHYQFIRTDLLYLVSIFLGFTAASIFKDYKDIPGDTKSATRTVYTILIDRGFSIASIHRYVTALVITIVTIPLIWLYLMHVALLWIALLFLIFIIPCYFSLKNKNRNASVAGTLWILVAYMIAVIILSYCYLIPLNLPAQFRSTLMTRPLSDYGQIHTSDANFLMVRPSSTSEVSEIIRYAYQHKISVRFRGVGHSMNAASLPTKKELLISTASLNDYAFEEAGTITVESGIPIYQLQSFLAMRGYQLPIYNDGIYGPSVGGFIAGGGIGRNSHLYGGFWENVLEITVVTGTGKIMHVTRDNPLFPWLFGSMGQLGLITSVKLKILSDSGKPYPMDQKGQIQINPHDRHMYDRIQHNENHLYWFTLFIPPQELDNAKKALVKLMEANPSTLDYLDIYEYPIKFFNFNPKLLYPFDTDFIGVGIWGHQEKITPQKLLNLERQFMKLVEDNYNRGYRRYIQTEITSDDIDYKKYFGSSVYNPFLSLKKEMDPAGIFNQHIFF